jgi:hypothetical protein
MDSPIFKEELIPTLLKIFLEIVREGTLSKSFYGGSVTPSPKPDKHTTNKEN